MSLKTFSNSNSRDFPMLTHYATCVPGKTSKSGKLILNPCTAVSKGAPDFFKISSVVVRNNKDIFLSSAHNFHYADITNRSKPFDLNILKPSQSLDLIHFKRHDVKLKAPYFEAYQHHLTRTGFGRSRGAFTQIANSSKTDRAEGGLKSRELNMTNRCQFNRTNLKSTSKVRSTH